MTELQTIRLVRKPFHVEAVQVTAENIHQVAAWCGGTVQVKFTSESIDTASEKFFVKVEVKRPLNERQTQAFIGDWVLKAGAGFKVYGDQSLKSTFDELKPITGIKVVDMDIVKGRPLTAMGKALVEAQNRAAVETVEEVFAESHEASAFTD